MAPIFFLYEESEVDILRKITKDRPYNIAWKTFVAQFNARVNVARK